MKKLLLASAIAATLLNLPATAAPIECNAECLKPLHDGDALMNAMKMTEALHAYQEAAKADPSSSMPYSHVAMLYFTASQHTSKEFVAEYRQRAADAAKRALAIEPADPFALLVVRELEEGEVDPLKDIPADALAEHRLAERDFQAKQFDGAIVHYKKAIELYPNFDVAYTYLGDAYYSTNRFAEAEQSYRKAIAINPSNTQALRFLSDALIKQNRLDEVPQLLETAVAIKPNDIPSWDHLETYLKSQHTAMQRLNYRQRASFDTKQNSIHLDDDLFGNGDSPDGAIWMGYATSAVTGKDDGKSAFVRELTAWKAAMQVGDELEQKDGKSASDPTLQLLRRFHKDGQLKAALLILTFHETYRADFEAWKKENPGAVAKFIGTYFVRP